MKKAKCMAEGDLIETETAQGQNKNIDDETRRKAMEMVNSRIEDEPMIDMSMPKKAKEKKAKSKTNAATESHSRMNAMGDTYRKGGYVRAADGCATRGKTKGRMV